MRFPVIFVILAAFIVLAPLDAASAQVPDTGPQLADTGDFQIIWEVKNRFRLFRKDADFKRQEAASRGDGILAAEQRLERDSGGLGWAKDVVGNLCLDPYGNLLQTCERDGVNESYLTPRDHPITVGISGTPPPDATCAWSFDDGQGQLRQMSAPCNSLVDLRVPYGRATVATVDITFSDGTTQRGVTDIDVRDLLIAGLGDSIAAGEGDPDRAVRLEGGFCFRRFGTGEQYYRPGRAGFTGDRSCENAPTNDNADRDWARHGARWMSPGCHRSLYSYQLRAALALAVEQPHLAVTFLPLACTGASIQTGMFAGQSYDDCPTAIGVDCSGSAPAQLTELKNIMDDVHKQAPQRGLDMIFLTIGANDINFASVVANVIVDAPTERLILGRGGGIVSVNDAEKALEQKLPEQFARLRAALKPYVDGNLSRIVFVSYANPAMQAADKPCPGGRDGFDVHPAFSADTERLRAAAEFVEQKFLPAIKALATCDPANLCRDPMSDRMAFVDAHQAAFENHGMCVRSANDPVFDRECFSTSGKSFVTNLVAAAEDPMACSLPASDYQPYAPRGRWIRTANDSYFTAMTYPQGIPATLRPTDIHDALWGVVSAVYGGAVHPTAEGYAAMADAALPAARAILGLQEPPAVSAEPLPPLAPAAPPGATPVAPSPAAPAPVPAAPAPQPLTILPPPTP
jgi:lysophospholipase L1-like esterase